MKSFIAESKIFVGIRPNSNCTHLLPYLLISSILIALIGLSIRPVSAAAMTPTITINDVTVNEGAGVAQFTLTLTAISSSLVTVDVFTQDGSAGSSDYTPISAQTINIPAGMLSATVSVTIDDDTLPEPDETFLLKLTNPTNATIGDGTGIATILDNDNLPSIVVDDVMVNESAGIALFTLTLSGTSSNVVNVDVFTQDVSADSSDYTPIIVQTVTFPAGALSATVSVTINVDTLLEPNETFLLKLTNPTNATIGDGTGEATIIDSLPPSIAVDDVTVNEGAGVALFTLTLSAMSSTPVTVDVFTQDGSAGLNDYTSISAQTINFPAGSLSATVSVTINNDTLLEPDETFFLKLTSPNNATIADGTGIATIVDSLPPSIVVDDVTVNEGAGVVLFTLTLSNISSALSVDVSTSYGSAGASDYTSISAQTINFPAGTLSATVSVTINDDTLPEPVEMFTLGLINPINATIADGTGIATIVDNDSVATAVSMSNTLASTSPTLPTLLFAAILLVATIPKRFLRLYCC